MAPFRLRFDAAHMEKLVADGLADDSYLAAARDFRVVADAMVGIVCCSEANPSINFS